MLRLLRPLRMRALCALTSVQGVPRGPPVRRMRRTRSGIFPRSFRLQSAHYAREMIAEICSLGVDGCAPLALTVDPGLPSRANPRDACVAPLATAIISQTGS